MWRQAETVCVRPWPDCIVIYGLCLLSGFGPGLVWSLHSQTFWWVMSQLLQCSSRPSSTCTQSQGHTCVWFVLCLKGTDPCTNTLWIQCGLVIVSRQDYLLMYIKVTRVCVRLLDQWHFRFRSVTRPRCVQLVSRYMHQLYVCSTSAHFFVFSSSLLYRWDILTETNVLMKWCFNTAKPFTSHGDRMVSLWSCLKEFFTKTDYSPSLVSFVCLMQVCFLSLSFSVGITEWPPQYSCGWR